MGLPIDRVLDMLQHHCQAYPSSESCRFNVSGGSSMPAVQSSQLMNSVGIPQVNKDGCESITLLSEDHLPVIRPDTTVLPPISKFM